MSHSNANNQHDPNAALRTLEQELHALAAQERAAAPAGLEQRIALVASPKRRTVSPALAPARAEAGVLARIGGRARWAVAAALLAGAALLLALPSTERAPGGPQAATVGAIEAEMDAWLTEPVFLSDESFTLLREAVDGFDPRLGDDASMESDALLTIELETTS